MFITVTKTIIDHATGDVHCYYTVSKDNFTATNQHAQFSEKESPLSKPDWSNADIIAAVAARLDVAVKAITVAEPPVPTEDESLGDPEE